MHHVDDPATMTPEVAAILAREILRL